MPVPTETFRDIKKLNLLFAFSAVLLLVAVLGLVLEDQNRDWRKFQLDARAWRADMIRDDQRRALSAENEQKLALIDAQIEKMAQRLREGKFSELGDLTIAQANARIAELKTEITRIKLPTDIIKSDLTPLKQQKERALLARDEAGAKAISDKLAQRQAQFDENWAQISARKQKVQELEDGLRHVQDKAAALDREKAALQRERVSLVESLNTNDPQGAAKIGELLRNAPLLDWGNPSLTPKQVVTPAVLTDYNLIKVETIDRCQTCHINIDNPRFEKTAFIEFVERQVAQSEQAGLNLTQISKPVVLLSFWTRSASQVPSIPLQKSLGELTDAALSQLNQRRQRAGQEPAQLRKLVEAAKAAASQDPAIKAAVEALDQSLRTKVEGKLKGKPLTVTGTVVDAVVAAGGKDQAYFTELQTYSTSLQEKLRSLLPEARRSVVDEAVRSALVEGLEAATRSGAAGGISARQWYSVASDYVQDVQSLLREHLTKEHGPRAYEDLRDLYRTKLVEHYNSIRREKGQSQLSNSAVLLGHPKMDLYVDADSAHPMAKVGCTSCHDGSGQETLFEHTAHMPRDIWVDAKTGSPVPSFLVQQGHGHDGHGHEAPAASNQHVAKASPEAAKPATRDGASIVLASNPAPKASEDAPHSGPAAAATAKPQGPVYSQFDVNLADPHNPAPLAPEAGGHHGPATYIDPSTGSTAQAVKQHDHWVKAYGWAHVHYMHWEKPMHTLDYVESSCARCHTQISDLQDSAPVLYEGRQLATQLGCINCHTMEQHQNAPDVKRVGPSLLHVGQKLSPQMMANWIWAPKSFRPSSRMPHYFMLENNSAPVDILRTRTEVTAMSHYLRHAPSAAESQYRDLAAQAKKLGDEAAALKAVQDDAKSSESQKAEAAAKLQGLSLTLQSLSDKMNEAWKAIPSYKPEPLPDAQAMAKSLQDQAAKLKQEMTSAKAPIDKKVLEVQAAQLEARAAKWNAHPKGDVAAGRELFLNMGCLSCHANLNEHGEQWVIGDLTRRLGLDAAQAKQQYDAMDYNQRHVHVLLHTPEKLARTGPELSGVGSKLLAGRPADKAESQARAWLYDWLRNPRHYSDYTIMPSFRLSEDEASDLAAYLLAQKRPGVDSAGHATAQYQPDPFGFDENGQPALDPLAKQMLEELVVSLKAAGSTKDAVRPAVKAMSDDEQLDYLGKKMISHYGCNGCHKINGFETATAPCANLSDWGVKDPHKLDFGYFDHAFDKQRKRPIEGIWKVAHEGLGSNAPHVKVSLDPSAGKPALAVNPAIRQHSLLWEEMDLERRPWLYNKLHNTRVYNRGQVSLEGGLRVSSEGKLEIDLGAPYDKLKMPKFHLTDQQVRSIVTFITSLRPSLVSPELQKVADAAGKRLTTGRQVANLYNCQACHEIEGNKVLLRQFYPDALNPDGTWNYGVLWDRTPPRLVGQGAKTQPEWLVHFLQHVHKIRPTKEDGSPTNLQVRMPSFPMGGDEATLLADYFSGWSQTYARKLNLWLGTIQDQIKAREAQVVRIEARIAELQQRLASLADGTEEKKLLQKQIAALRDGDLAALQDYSNDWYLNTQNPALARAVKKVKELAYKLDLARPGQLEPREPLFADADEAKAWAEERRVAWNSTLDALTFLQNTLDVSYPFEPKRRQAVDADRFSRGQALFKELGCTLCHALGDDQKLLSVWKLDNAALAGAAAVPAAAANAGDDYDAKPAAPAAKPAAKDDDYDSPKPAAKPKAGDDYGDETAAAPAAPQAPPTLGPVFNAPNLRHAHQRLQWHWFEQWLQRPNTIVPGTKMPAWFKPENKGELDLITALPPEERLKRHQLYGYTGAAQRELLMDFVYASGMTGYTYGEERLPATQRQILTDLPPLPEPPKPQKPALPESLVTEAKPKQQAAQAADTAAVKVEVKTKSDITLHEGTVEAKGKEAGTGKVVGVVSWSGAPKTREPVVMAKDPYCNNRNSPPHLTEAYVVNSDKSLQNVLIHVKSGLPAGKKYPAPKTPVVLDQHNCAYVPHVVAAMVGQPVIIPNSDSTAHNVLMTSKANGTFNEGMPVQGMKLNKTFKKPELNMRYECSVHPWMNAQMHILDHPYFFVSDVEGRFEITGLPPGRYELEALHERPEVQPVTFEVEVKADSSTRADVSLK